MSHLYQTFAGQVSNHCRSNGSGVKSSPVAECKRDLLMYGVKKLQKLSDVELDAMDPFQRDAMDISKSLKTIFIQCAVSFLVYNIFTLLMIILFIFHLQHNEP